jgi:hypothetical protein
LQPPARKSGPVSSRRKSGRQPGPFRLRKTCRNGRQVGHVVRRREQRPLATMLFYIVILSDVLT